MLMETYKLPLTDGLLVLRALFGFKGNSLVDSAISSDASRETPEAINGYLTSIGLGPTAGEPDSNDSASSGSPEADTDLRVFGNGVVESTWDRGINAFDQALGWRDSQDSDSRCSSFLGSWWQNRPEVMF